MSCLTDHDGAVDHHHGGAHTLLAFDRLLTHPVKSCQWLSSGSRFLLRSTLRPPPSAPNSTAVGRCKSGGGNEIQSRTPRVRNTVLQTGVTIHKKKQNTCREHGGCELDLVGGEEERAAVVALTTLVLRVGHHHDHVVTRLGLLRDTRQSQNCEWTAARGQVLFCLPRAQCKVGTWCDKLERISNNEKGTPSTEWKTSLSARGKETRSAARQRRVLASATAWAMLSSSQDSFAPSFLPSRAEVPPALALLALRAPQSVVRHEYDGALPSSAPSAPPLVSAAPVARPGHNTISIVLARYPKPTA